MTEAPPPSEAPPKREVKQPTIPKYDTSVYDRKVKMTQEFFKYKDHTRLPKHPAVTGRMDQCWACGKDADPEKCVFKERVAPRLPDPKNPEPIKVCIFRSVECWMGGWPLVRHHYVLAGPDPDEEAKPDPKPAEEVASSA